MGVGSSSSAMSRTSWANAGRTCSGYLAPLDDFGRLRGCCARADRQVEQANGAGQTGLWKCLRLASLLDSALELGQADVVAAGLRHALGAVNANKHRVGQGRARRLAKGFLQLRPQPGSSQDIEELSGARNCWTVNAEAAASRSGVVSDASQPPLETTSVWWRSRIVKTCSPCA
jgi:hypothetical protein